MTARLTAGVGCQISLHLAESRTGRAVSATQSGMVTPPTLLGWEQELLDQRPPPGEYRPVPKVPTAVPPPDHLADPLADLRGRLVERIGRGPNGNEVILRNQLHPIAHSSTSETWTARMSDLPNFRNGSVVAREKSVSSVPQ